MTLRSCGKIATRFISTSARQKENQSYETTLSLAFTFAAAELVVGLVAGAGLIRQAASAQGSSDRVPMSDLRGVTLVGVSPGGDVVLPYGSGVIAMVHPGTASQPTGYVHTYRVSPTGAISALDAKTLDTDSGKIVTGNSTAFTQAGCGRTIGG